MTWDIRDTKRSASEKVNVSRKEKRQKITHAQNTSVANSEAMSAAKEPLASMGTPIHEYSNILQFQSQQEQHQIADNFYAEQDIYYISDKRWKQMRSLYMRIPDGFLQ